MIPKPNPHILKIHPYEPGKPIDEVKRELGLTEDPIKLASNESACGPSKLAIQAIIEKLDKIYEYPEASAYELVQDLAKKYKINADQILLAGGGDELIRLIALVYLGSDSQCLISKPSFPIYKIAAEIVNADIIMVPLKNYVHDLEALVGKITPRTKVIFLDNPNNPVGSVFTDSAFKKFIQAVPESVLVVVDEAYYDFVTDENYPQTLDYLPKYENLMILRTFSKNLGLAGLRVAYAFAHREIISLVMRVRPVFTPNLLAQWAAKAALKDEDHIKKTLKLNEEGKSYLYKEFKRLNLDFQPSQTNYIYVDLHRNAREVFDKLLHQGVIIRPVSETAVRITIGTAEQNQKLIQALEIVLGI